MKCPEHTDVEMRAEYSTYFCDCCLRHRERCTVTYGTSMCHRLKDHRGPHMRFDINGNIEIAWSDPEYVGKYQPLVRTWLTTEGERLVDSGSIREEE